MSSGTRDFINRFYGSSFDGQIVDYVVYQDEQQYITGDYENSKLITSLTELVFINP